MSDLLVVPGGPGSTPSAELVEAGYESAPVDLQVGQFSEAIDGKQALNVAFLTGPDPRGPQGPGGRHPEDHGIPPAGVTLTPSGLVVVGVGLLDNLQANRILLTYLSIAFVGIFLTIRLRSLIRSLLSLVPVLITVGVSSLVACASTSSSVADDGGGRPAGGGRLHRVHVADPAALGGGRGRGLSPREAVDVAAARTGRAFIVSALTAISGVAVISFSTMPLLRDSVGSWA